MAELFEIVGEDFFKPFTCLRTTANWSRKQYVYKFDVNLTSLN